MAEAPQAVENKKSKRGRKPADESRAAAIRARLVMWRQTPEAQRVSLRALAIELGTSHQLLAFYLRGLDKWQMKEYERKAKEIRTRAGVENRSLTSHVDYYDRAAFHFMIEQSVGDELKRIAVDAKADKLTGVQLKVVKVLAQQWGIPVAQKILQKHMAQKTGPKKGTKLDAVRKELESTTDSEKYLRLIRKLTPAEREELRVSQEKRTANGVGISMGRRMVEKRRNNLPALPTIAAKSFRTDSPNLATPLKNLSHAVS